MKKLESAQAAAEQTAADKVAAADKLASELAERSGEIETLKDKLAANETDQASGLDELSRALADMETELARSKASIKELEAAKKALGEDLDERSRMKETLERQLENVESRHASDIDDLSQHIQAMETALADAEEKLANKDNAISALLSELAEKSRSIESIDEIEHVIHEIDGRMSERFDIGAEGDKDRPTRVLTGTIDGQELRFPLFKDRLTVGRTATNDIQLRAQYVSRRHAIILVEGETTRIVDWGSKNGVYVNKVRISDQTLTNGDLVAIGNAEFVYEERARRETH